MRMRETADAITTTKTRVNANVITQKEVHAQAQRNGFHEHPRGCGVAVALAQIASEVFEAIAAHRRWEDTKVQEELADVLLRTFDLAEQLGFDVMAEAEQKHKLNLSRPFRHGDKRY